MERTWVQSSVSINNLEATELGDSEGDTEEGSSRLIEDDTESIASTPHSFSYQSVGSSQKSRTDSNWSIADETADDVGEDINENFSSNAQEDTEMVALSLSLFPYHSVADFKRLESTTYLREQHDERIWSGSRDDHRRDSDGSIDKKS